LKVGKESKNKNKLEEKAMRRILFLLGIIVLFVSISLGQATFESAVTTGNWNSSSSWTITSGSDEDGIPDANDDVIIKYYFEWRCCLQ
jgi:hypothetical protein